VLIARRSSNTTGGWFFSGGLGVLVFQMLRSSALKQVPGTSFLWRESNFTLADDSDYRVVEQRLLAAIDAVFQEFKANFELMGHQMEEKLSSITVGPSAPDFGFGRPPQGLRSFSASRWRGDWPRKWTIVSDGRS
jgi:hypothetical protein